MRRPRPEPPTLEHVRYAPPGAYRLDLEVMTMTELRRRAPRARLRAPHRLDFIALIGVTRGRCRHFVDFVPYECRAGSWVVVRPGQVHRYDTTSAWDGYQVVFRPEFLLPLQQGAAPIDSAVYASLEGLPTQVTFERAQSRAALACVVQMSLDATAGVAEGLRHPLLRHQLYSLVLRLLAASERSPPEREPASVQVQRFKRFRQAVERDFARTHRVTDYARRLGYAEKTLTRAVAAATAMSAKSYLSRRVALEAKRLLAHTALPVATIAAEVGFAESTNFVKFFKREAGMSPGAFRRQATKR